MALAAPSAVCSFGRACAKATSFTFDTDEIQHGQVQFRVLGSDGFNTTDVVSPVITVVGPSGDVDCNGTVDGADALLSLIHI